jgi:Zn-dependent protease
MLGMPPELFLLRIPVILLALTVHEVAHGWAALRLGDPTAKNEGRLTLNPLPHLDLLGTIMLMTGLFGWAKPVPVNGYYLRNPKRDLMLISLAGPLSNIAQAILFGLTLRIIMTVDQGYLETEYGRYLLIFLMLGFQINAGIAFFNLLPFPPLDGSKILAWAMPDKYVPAYMNATAQALPIIFGLVIIGAITKIDILWMIIGPIFKPYLSILQLITFGHKVC